MPEGLGDPLGALVPGGALDRRDREDGPLAGLDFAVKDLFAVAGATATFGNPDWARSHLPAERDAPPVAACLEAGARLVGRTVLDELAYSLSGRNPHHGAPTNANAPGRTTGGSSCGSAAAVAGGLADFALGTDTGGSVRVPASFCGIPGIRPSHGAVSLADAAALAPSFDTAGWFARDAEVLEAVGDVLLPPAEDGPTSPAGLLIAEDALALAAPAAQAALAPLLERLEQRLGAAERVTLGEPGGGLEAWGRRFLAIQAREAYASLGPWIADTKPVLGPEMTERWTFVTSVSAEEADAAAAAREELRARLDDILAGDRVIALPAAPDVAPASGADPAALRRQRSQVMSLTSPASLAGLPQVTLPLAQVEGLPLGLGLIGPRGSDRMLLAFARQFSDSLARDPGARFD